MKSERLYLHHILECIERIELYKSNSFQEFLPDLKTQDAIIRNLQILSESTLFVSEKTKTAYPEIPWREISGFRNVLVHDYLKINIERVWIIVDKDLPGLKIGIKKILSTIEK